MAAVGRPSLSPSALSVPIGIAAAVGVRAMAPFDPAGATMLAITTLCIALWIGNVVSPAYTGVVCLGLLGLAFSLELALVGFRSPAIWLIAFGLVMGEATRRSGLAEWASGRIVHRLTPPAAAEAPVRTYRRLLFGLSTAGLFLVLVIPAGIVRVLVLAPVALEVGERFDSRAASLGLFFGPVLVTYLGTVAVLTGGAPNIVVLGIFESITGVSIAWTEWFALLFPVMGVGRLLVIVGVAYALYRPTSETAFEPPERDARAMGRRERRMLVFLLAGVAVWVTDVFHGLHPVYGAMLVALLACLPGVGIVDFEAAVGEVDFSILFFIAAVLAIGEGMTRTSVAAAMAERLLAVVPTGAPLVVVLGIVFAFTVLLLFVISGLAAASVVTPVVVAFAGNAGLPVVPVTLTEAVALQMPFFPYQSAVLVVILAYDIVETRELIRVVAAVTVATIVVLVPIQLGVLAAFG
ncbi:SLC13 family permease [Halobellus rubicundus]|uniref:SLC13 family permease n=1 Tax=Halobellus rubicundus TaxID=2996466 RepID=A0ABD5MEK2_9EURY